MRAGFALVAAVLCAASGARAQDADPVTLYGRVYALVESVEVRGPEPAVRRIRVTDQASRLGVRGTENLGSGHSVWFQLETGFAVDAPGTFAGRESGAGFVGPWGTFLAGRWDSAFTASQTSVDPFGHLGLGDIAGAALNQGNFTRRERNTVQYWAPRVAGLRTKMSYAANEGRTANVNPYDYAVNVSFEDSATYVAIAFEKHKDQAGATVTAGSEEDGWGLAGMRRFGPLKVSGQYGRYRRSGVPTQKSYMVGVEVTQGKHQLLASFQGSRGGAAAAAEPPRCTLVALGYRYRISLRTFLVAQYARVDNKVGALCNFGTNPVVIIAHQDLAGLGMGMRTTF